MQITVIFENDEFMIINKPAGMTVHNPTPGEKCLLDLLPGKNHLVNRLDKETSGLVVVAKNSSSAAELMQVMNEDSCHKTYVAVLRGSLLQPGSQTSDFISAWDWPLTDKAEGRQNPQGISKDRKPCKTLWKVLSSSPYLTMIEAQILTGRQHQIRKHTALAKHAIVGDPRYNDPKYNKKMADIYKNPRMFLHALNLKFEWKQKKWDFTAPLPQEFSDLFKSTAMVL